MNMKNISTEKEIANVLKVLGAPFRVRLLYAIGEGEACVCHLETILHKRQAYISQHLMVLRDAGMLNTRREGKYVYYRVSDVNIFDLFAHAAELLGIPQRDLPGVDGAENIASCCCPNCQGELAVEEN